MTINTNRGLNRIIAAGSVFLAAATLAISLPQSAEAQGGQRRSNRQNRLDRQDRENDRYTYGRVTFDWDTNGFNVRDQAALEDQIRRDLNRDAGSRLISRRSGSRGTLDVNVAFRRVNSNTVRADVRLGLNQDGRGGSAVTATESATTMSRDKNIPSDVVLQAYRGAHREFTTNVNRYARNDR